ncbi:PAS domain-containing sensor histidine kinase [Bradyrhizobium jicamae]|nr:ATP-binding protein [Bradyrhizobium jicamae]
MTWVEKLSDSHNLRKCLRDLIALSTLPATWKDYQPQQIADSVSAALLTMLSADFVYVTLPGTRNGPSVEATRSGSRMSAAFVRAVEIAVRSSGSGPSEQTMLMANPTGAGELAIVSVPIGFTGTAKVVAGSLRSRFPNEKERLLLGIAANDATLAVSRWQSETEQRRLVTVIERSSEFIGFASMEGIPQYINPAGRDLVGLSLNAPISHLLIFDIIAERDREHARDTLLPIVLQTGRWLGELDFQHFQTGETIPFFVDWFRIDDPRTGRPMNLATVSRDLRNQKKLEADLRKVNESLERRVIERTTELDAQIAERERADARARDLQLELLHASRLSVAGQMAGALAHEINQPLTALANSVNAVRRMMANSNAHRIDVYREIMDEAAELALGTGRIIGRLREFVTREEAEMRIEALSVLIRDASHFALAGSAARIAQVRFSFDPKAENVLANRVQVQQLLVNLLRNANEAMMGSHRYDIEVTTALLDDEFVEIAVADRGPGLPAEIASHLFEAFRSTKRNGMGLGLTICKSIAESHGGTLRYEANPGGGTIFRFTLPSLPKNVPADAG